MSIGLFIFLCNENSVQVVDTFDFKTSDSIRLLDLLFID